MGFGRNIVGVVGADCGLVGNCTVVAAGDVDVAAVGRNVVGVVVAGDVGVDGVDSGSDGLGIAAADAGRVHELQATGCFAPGQLQHW